MSVEDDFEEHRRALAAATVSLPALIAAAAERIGRSLQGGGALLVFGNGGSAAHAQHFVAELVGRFERDRPALRAVAPSADAATLTAVANDFGFQQAFARQVEALARPGDAVLLVSVSGRSPNVVAAAHAARARGCVVVALTGAAGLDPPGLADVVVAVPWGSVPRVQEMHTLCLHSLAKLLEAPLP